MATPTDVLNQIAASIKSNGVGAITGASLAAVLVAIVGLFSNYATKVDTDAALAATATATFPNGVLRLDYSAGFGATPLVFSPQAGNCAANSMVNDGGSCRDTTTGDGNSWKAVFPRSGVSPAQFGASPKGTGNAATGINLAANYIRSQGLSSGQFHSSLDLSNGNWNITTPVNLTCISDQTSGVDGCPNNAAASGPFVVNGSGALITCVMNGGTCIDGLGSNFIQIIGRPQVIGGCTAGVNEPDYGYVFGRAAHQINGSNHILEISGTGCFKKADLILSGAEVVEVRNPFLLNNDQTGGGVAYAIILDTGNHWNITSTFVTNSNGVDSLGSMNDLIIRGGQFGAAGNVSTAKALWVGGTAGTNLDNVFMDSYSTECVTVYLASSSISDMPTSFRLRGHCEGFGAYPANWFSFKSKTAGTVADIRDFQFSEYSSGVTSSIFAKDANTTSVYFKGEKLYIDSNAGATPAVTSGSGFVIDNPADDYLRGSYSNWVPTIGSVNCTGLGTGGTCSLQNNAGSIGKGLLQLTTGTTPGNSVIVDLAQSAVTVGGDTWACQFSLLNNDGSWDTGATVSAYTPTRQGFTVYAKNNGVSLTASKTYWVAYRCLGLSN
jgi:hypothetical protein